MKRCNTDYSFWFSQFIQKCTMKGPELHIVPEIWTGEGIGSWLYGRMEPNDNNNYNKNLLFYGTHVNKTKLWIFQM